MGRSGFGLMGWVVVTFSAALVGAFSARSAQAFYASLRKPVWAPPSWLFGPAWTVLYLLMAVAAWTVWRDAGFTGARSALVWYGIQLVLNAAWSWLFFVKRNGQQAFAEVLVLWSAIAMTMVGFWQVNPSAGILLVPYLAWVSFATALTWSVWRRNPDLL